MKIKELAIGVASILFSIFLLWEGAKYPFFTITGEFIPGPGFFPLILEIIALLLGIFELISSFLLDLTATRDRPSLKSIKNAIVYLTIMILYVLSLGHINFIVITFFFLFASSLFLGAKPFAGLLFSLIASILTFVLFQIVLGVYLP